MSLKVSRILHAGYVFECDGIQIAFDPIFENPFSKNCYAFPNVRFDLEQIRGLNFQAVFISHFHDDHCSLESLNLLDRKTPIYIYCLFEELIVMIKELGFIHVHALAINRPVRVGPFEVLPRRALDAEVDSIFHVRAAGLNVLNVVDSWIDHETLDLLRDSGPWDLILWPFQTMRELEVIAPFRAQAASRELPPEWIEQIRILNPRYIVPSSCQFIQESWSWYNHAFFPITYQQFQREVNGILPLTCVVRMNPSVSVILDKDSLEYGGTLSWMAPVGEQDVDYKYKPDLIPPPTAVIAQRFPPLTSTETERVYDYCKDGLMQKFRSLESSEDIFFTKPRLWRLSVFDHLGDSRDFHYLLKGAEIEAAVGTEALLSWTTEIPISKFYGGLEFGESLTSMYFRINDCRFDPDIECDLRSVEIVEDPLIRCLFSGNFGAYQRAQLKKLKAQERTKPNSSL